METASYELWFGVRYMHVVSIALLTGGASLVCACCAAPAARRASLVAIATGYEWLFWSVIGVTVATGVSNLGLKGDGLLGSETGWGAALSIKLAAVLLSLALSVVRSDFVIRARVVDGLGATTRGRVVLGVLYGLTLALLLGALWIGLGLAHGRY